jgi:hypothetical protein
MADEIEDKADFIKDMSELEDDDLEQDKVDTSLLLVLRCILSAPLR